MLKNKKVILTITIIILFIIIVVVDLFIPRLKMTQDVDYEDSDKLFKTYSYEEKENYMSFAVYRKGPEKIKTTYYFNDNDEIEYLIIEDTFSNKINAISRYLDKSYRDDKTESVKLKNNATIFYKKATGTRKDIEEMFDKTIKINDNIIINDN